MRIRNEVLDNEKGEILREILERKDKEIGAEKERKLRDIERIKKLKTKLI